VSKDPDLDIGPGFKLLIAFCALLSRAATGVGIWAVVVLVLHFKGAVHGLPGAAITITELP
jgi:hypothetical protein